MGAATPALGRLPPRRCTIVGRVGRVVISASSSSAATHAVRRGRRWARVTARTVFSLLLATVLSLMVVLADRLVYLWSDGQLVVAIVVLWGVLFAGLALLSGIVQRWSERLAALFHGVSQRVAQAQLETRLLEQARQDPRALADLRTALASEEPANGLPPRDPSDLH